MALYTRRKLLRDLGIASASVAALGTEGCFFPVARLDLYVLLQGPWILSTANGKYLRAVTAKLCNHAYHFFDPHPDPSPPAPFNSGKTGPPILQSPSIADLGEAKVVQFTVERGCTCAAPLPPEERSHLFAAMCDQSQGLFYANEVVLPEVLCPNLHPLEIQLSYPDAIYAMDIQRKFRFDPSDSLLDKRVALWPSTIVLRYRNWTGANCSVDGVSLPSIAREQSQTHRKFSISQFVSDPRSDAASGAQVAPSKPASVQQEPAKPAQAAVAHQACLKKPVQDSSSGQPVENEMTTTWAAVMQLLKFKYERVPAPVLAACKHPGDYTTLKAPSDSAITQDELDCLPLPSNRPAGDTKLKPSKAGSAGVHNF